MLHIIASATLNQILVERIAVGSAVLLLDANVWALLPDHQDHVQIEALLEKSCQLYVLNDWLSVNGLANLPEQIGVTRIDYAGWVALTVEHSVIQTWN